MPTRGISVDCLCGETVPTKFFIAGKCDTDCGGDKTMACGSDTNMSVFKWRKDTPSPPVPPPVTPPTTLWADEVDGAYLKGCFEDTTGSRVLDGYYYSSTTLTAEVRRTRGLTLRACSTGKLSSPGSNAAVLFVGHVGSMCFCAFCAH